MAGDRKLTVRFLGQDNGLGKNVKQLVSDMDAAETAGKRVASAITMLADDAETGMTQAAAAAEKLATALGTETVQAMQAGGRTTEGWVADLKKMGLTFEEIEADADALAAAIKRAESVAGSGLAPLGNNARTAADSVRTLGVEGDNSRSVLANMVGNSVQDLGQLGGVAGSAGVMIGQLAEYAADGNIKMAGLAKFVGPMAALGVATYGVSAAMKAQADQAAEVARVTQLLIDLEAKRADGDTEGVIAGLAEEWANTLPILEKYGMGVAEIDAVLGGSTRPIEELRAEMEYYNAELLKGNEYTQAEINAMYDKSAELQAVIRNLEEANTAQGDASEQIHNSKSSLEAWTEYTRGEMIPAMSELTGWWSKIKDAADDTAEQTEGQRQQGQAIAYLRNELEQYKKSLEGVPDEAFTKIEAALDRGDLATAEALLNNLARERSALVKVQLAFGAATKQVGKGSAVGTGAKGSTASYDPQSVLAGIFSDAKAAGSGGGGGGGGGGAATVEDAGLVFDQAIGNLFDTGQTSLANYRQYLQGRLGAYETFSNEYKTIWSRLRELDRIETDAAKEAADAEKKKQDEAKKAADEQTKLAEKQLAALQQLLDLLTGFAGAEYGNLNQPGNVVGSGAAASMNAGQLAGLIADLLRFYQEGMS